MIKLIKEEIEKIEEELEMEKTPEGWEPVVKALKDSPSARNPYAIVNSMRNKGDKRHQGRPVVRGTRKNPHHYEHKGI
ncbi:MAG: hypothetical protein ACREQ5_37310 [Candidatus Dormibacteria bacterium]